MQSISGSKASLDCDLGYSLVLRYRRESSGAYRQRHNEKPILDITDREGAFACSEGFRRLAALAAARAPIAVRGSCDCAFGTAGDAPVDYTYRGTRVTLLFMQRRITQRELRKSGEILRALDAGESFLVIRNGVAVAEMIPARRRKFTSRDEIVKAFKNAPSVDAKQFFADVDAFSTKTQPFVNNELNRGILDTCVLVDIEKIEPTKFPEEAIITTLSLAESAVGPHAAQDPIERARRQDRSQTLETMFEALPFDASAARAYGRIYALELAGGPKPRGPERWTSPSPRLRSPKVSLYTREIPQISQT